MLRYAMSGIELADIMSGYSICRNTQFARIFYRLQLSEAYGTETSKIFKVYQSIGLASKIEITPNVLKISLPNTRVATNPASETHTLNSDERVLELARDLGVISRKDVERLLEITQTPVGRILKNLVEVGSLVKSGNGKNAKYLSP